MNERRLGGTCNVVRILIGRGTVALHFIFYAAIKSQFQSLVLFPIFFISLSNRNAVLDVVSRDLYST